MATRRTTGWWRVLAARSGRSRCCPSMKKDHRGSLPKISSLSRGARRRSTGLAGRKWDHRPPLHRVDINAWVAYEVFGSLDTVITCISTTIAMKLINCVVSETPAGKTRENANDA